MHISITYCGRWKYGPKATSLAATIKDTFSIEPELIEGSNGIFDVFADGTMVFSKHETDRFPEHAEVVNTLQNRGALPVKS